MLKSTGNSCRTKMSFLGLFAILLSVLSVHSTVYFKEQFLDGDAWRTRWVDSEQKDDYGTWEVTAGNLYGDPELDKGLQTSQDARFYATSTRFEPFSNEGKTLVIQYSVKHEQKIDCGGGYVKVFPADLEQTNMHGDSQYYIMFGPDICGFNHKKIHVIFNYKDQNHLIKKDIKCPDDEVTHLYTLILNPDQTYEVRVDNEMVESGSLEDDWDFLLPRKIPDPEAQKPEDWVDIAMIPDPDDTKPEDWEQPRMIPEPGAKKPSDWDEDMDGEWEAAKVPNPDFKGEWQPRDIDNPAYKGEWEHPQLDNPDYVPDPEIYKFDNIGVLGLDLWQVKSGTVFDNFLITDDVKEAEDFGEKTWGVTKGPEMKMKEAHDEIKRIEEEEEKAKAQAEAEANEGKQEEEEDDDDDDDDEDGDEGADDDAEGEDDTSKDEL